MIVRRRISIDFPLSPVHYKIHIERIDVVYTRLKEIHEIVPTIASPLVVIVALLVFAQVDEHYSKPTSKVDLDSVDGSSQAGN